MKYFRVCLKLSSPRVVSLYFHIFQVLYIIAANIKQATHVLVRLHLALLIQIHKPIETPETFGLSFFESWVFLNAN